MGQAEACPMESVDGAVALDAAGLTGAGVCAVTATVSGSQEGEAAGDGRGANVHTIAQASAELGAVGQDPGDGALGDVHDIVGGPAAVRKSSIVAGQEPETLGLLEGGCGDPGVKAQQVSDRAGVRGRAARTDRRHVLDE